MLIQVGEDIRTLPKPGTRQARTLRLLAQYSDKDKWATAHGLKCTQKQCASDIRHLRNKGFGIARSESGRYPKYKLRTRDDIQLAKLA